MKTRDSGMPAEAWWNTFFDPPVVLRDLGLDQVAGLVIDVGCGYGTFTLAIARATQQPVLALDIEQEMVAAVVRQAAAEGLGHVRAQVHDITSGSLGVATGAADAVLLFNILHCEAPLDLLRAAHVALRPGGRVGVIHWRSDVPTPRGPDLAIRPTPVQCTEWLLQTGYNITREAMTLPPYHFGVVGSVAT